MPKSPKSTILNNLDPEKDFSFGSGKFEFPNGDKYEGEYCAHISGIVWREGVGIYTTKDGHRYKAQWYTDKIVDNSEITIFYPRGEVFMGKIHKNKYNGPGCYFFPNNITLTCEFLDNKPVGDLLLLDRLGNPWHGQSSETNSTIFLPEHCFFDNIPEDLGKGKPIRPIFEVGGQDEEFLEEEQILDEKFADKSKLEPDLDFYQSEWFQKYLIFRKTHLNITNAIEEVGVEALNEVETKWFEDYQRFKQRYQSIFEDRKNTPKDLVDRKLFELFNSKDYKNTSIPIAVIYPNVVLKEKNSSSSSSSYEISAEGDN